MGNTHKDLANELKARNTEGKYDDFIFMCESYYFHCFKNPPFVPAPKLALLGQFSFFPELSDLRQKSIDGEYDEDLEDPEDMT